MVGRLGSRVEETVRRGIGLGSEWQSSLTVCSSSVACQASGRAGASGWLEEDERQERLPFDHNASTRLSGLLSCDYAPRTLSVRPTVRRAKPLRSLISYFLISSLKARAGYSSAEAECGMRAAHVDDVLRFCSMPQPPAGAVRRTSTSSLSSLPSDPTLRRSFRLGCPSDRAMPACFPTVRRSAPGATHSCADSHALNLLVTLPPSHAVLRPRLTRLARQPIKRPATCPLLPLATTTRRAGVSASTTLSSFARPPQLGMPPVRAKTMTRAYEGRSFSHKRQAIGARSGFAEREDCARTRRARASLTGSEAASLRTGAAG